MSYDQANRVLAMKTELGEQAAMLMRLEGEDAISRPFLFRIHFSTESSPAEVKALLGTPVTLWVGRPDTAEAGSTALGRRPLHGRIRSLTRGMMARGEVTEWHAEVVPHLWFLSRTTDCRIFQEKSVPDIVKAVLDLHGVTGYEFRTVGTYDPVPFCVQYRESALDFVSRLMEQAGICYWHEHAEGAHTLVIADENGSAPAASFPALPLAAAARTAAIHSLDEEFAMRSGKWTLRDRNLDTPALDLQVDAPTQLDVEQIRIRERYDYPGLYADSAAGRNVARLRIEEEEAHHQRRHGRSGVAGLDAGLRITIEGIDDPEVLLTEVSHRAEDYSHWSTEMWAGREPRAPFYENNFVCIPKRVPFRAERVTPKPFVRGPQTAVVTGPSGEEIHTDKQGRVKVKFHWDRLNPADDTASCWLPVSQGWAGVGWGQVHIPRVGHEVIVDFLEGDPDRPIITGRVYHAENTVPYALPDNKTQSGIKTRSSPDGAATNFNELRFEDKKGAEQVYLQAERNLDLLVKNARTETINEGDLKGDDTYLLRKGNRIATIAEGNLTLTVTKGDMTVKVNEGNETRTVGKGNLSTTVSKGDYTLTVSEGDHSTSVSKGDCALTVGQGDHSTTVSKGDSKLTVSQGDYAATISKGDAKIAASAGAVTIEAAKSITLKVGANKIEITASGITVKGTLVTIEGQASAKITSPATEAGGSGSTRITGAAIMVG